MNPKKTSRLAASLKSAGPRITPKKPGPKKIRLAGARALAAAAHDDYWEINITISDANGNDVAWMSLRPPPPPPPIDPGRLTGWLQRSLGGR